MKIHIRFIGLNLNIIIHKKHQKSGHFMADTTKTGGIKNLMLRLGCCLPPTAYLRWLKSS